MKTNKEIKPFKMRCNLQQSKIVMSILRKNGRDTKWTPRQDSEKLCIVLYDNGDFTCLYAFGVFDLVGDDGCEELTYSEFMKLYGEEEEVFTREDIEHAMEWAAVNAIYGDEISLWTMNKSVGYINSRDLLTKFLSERTND